MKKNLRILLGQPNSIVEKFHQKTKLKKLPANIDQKLWPSEWKTTFFKEYPRLDKIILPEPENLNEISLEKALMMRKSTRSFSSKQLSLEKISKILFYSAGLRDNLPPWIGNRTYPSAGARYPLEVYLVSQRSELASGIYHYNLRTHSLEILETGKFNATRNFSGEWTETSIFILITAIFNRNMIKYSVRGYRHILEEAGHLSQNFYLVAAALDIGICGLGGYLDDRINEILDIDGVSESVIYSLALGNNEMLGD